MYIKLAQIVNYEIFKAYIYLLNEWKLACFHIAVFQFGLTQFLHCVMVAVVYVFSVLNNSEPLVLKILNICKIVLRARWKYVLGQIWLTGLEFENCGLESSFLVGFSAYECEVSITLILQYFPTIVLTILRISWTGTHNSAQNSETETETALSRE